jgi:hypothetical protein
LPPPAAAQGKDLTPAEALGRTVRHFFPELRAWMTLLRDGRNQSYIKRSQNSLLWMGLLTFCLKIGSRRQIGFELNTRLAKENLRRLSGDQQAEVAHPDTLEYYLQLLAPEEIQRLRRWMILRLIRMKALDDQRLEGTFLIVIDGTGQLTFDKPHCPNCLTRKSGDKVIYYHSVLEAKLVTSSGLAFSIGTEFIENSLPNATKQDCELKAFVRLARQLKKEFPQLRMCFLFDGLYANGTVFDICRLNRWNYIITFKQGSLPAVWREYQTAKYLQGQNHCLLEDPGQPRQSFAWATGLKHQDDQRRTHHLNAFECLEEVDGKCTTFAWLTNFPLDHRNTVTRLANRGGRCRWKIENEGFNIQKNGGYALEHAYSTHPQAWKHWYLLLQIAHLLMQLLERGNLLGNVQKVYGSFKAMGRRLGESLRLQLIDLIAIDPAVCLAIQIRFNSS